MKTIYELDLNESVEVESPVEGRTTDYSITYTVTRVPGGWLYKRDYKEGVPVFVPFNEEFNGKDQGN